jgi:3',5'-cyclic AMP phosphodiesterase CpdA
MKTFIDPRHGDFESDASSSKNRSILSLAGSLLAEISLPKLIVAWFVLLGFPALALGTMPIIASIWVNVVVTKFSSLAYGIIPVLLLIGLLAIGWLGGRRAFRLAERNFWSLNSLAVQPAYAVCRELLNQIADRLLPLDAAQRRRGRWRSVTAILAGVTICLTSVAILVLVWPHTRFAVEFSALSDPAALIKSALANSIAIVSGYVAVAVTAWTFADATMPPPLDFQNFDKPSGAARTWRVAHLSDIHVVGEQFGFRIESGRSGPQGNGQLVRALRKLDEIDAREPLDAILVTGDITDAGLSSEWAEFLTVLASFPRLARRTFLIPGNHDLNVVNRANPAQFDLPTSPYKKLRKIRALAALNAIQGDKVRIVDRAKRELDKTLEQAVAPYLDRLTQFAASGRPRLHTMLDELWSSVFPMVLPPQQDDGVGVILMNSNADTHFSFTNALGMVSADQFAGIAAAFSQFPNAGWVVCLHHHVIEYPRAASALSERIGTALINGHWFVRRLQPFADRIVVMHGHRHVDWFGECGSFPILSAPSTVMSEAANASTQFYIHTITVGAGPRLQLSRPQAIVVEGRADLEAIDADASRSVPHP